MREYGDASGAACSSPMVALTGAGSYGTVFHTKIGRNSRRACNFMIPSRSSAPAVFSILIARSTPAIAGRCQPMIYSLHGRAISWRTSAGIGCGFTRSLVRMTRSNAKGPVAIGIFAAV